MIGEDEALFRHGLLLVLEQGGFTVVEAAADATSLENAVHRQRPDLVIRSTHVESAVEILPRYLTCGIGDRGDPSD